MAKKTEKKPSDDVTETQGESVPVKRKADADVWPPKRGVVPPIIPQGPQHKHYWEKE